MSLHKLLIANRGEIAIRIARAAGEAGLGAQRVEIFAARNENHLFSRERQLRAEISAGAPRAINDNAHQSLPM
jgi:acetyl/propionyl-CoA carboxylase alpha subunit